MRPNAAGDAVDAFDVSCVLEDILQKVELFEGLCEPKRRPLSPISDSNVVAFCASARGYLDDGDDEGYDHEDNYDVYAREWF